jgi:uncharacterized glyoxalase superfamily protein PhnB
MVHNRTTGTASIIPELAYDDVGVAVDWLCETFGFTELWRAGSHRARVAYGNGVVIVADTTHGREAPDQTGMTHSVMVKVDDADSHYEHARRCGAKILSGPEDHHYGERQYSVEDPGGHHWTFSQSIADVAPEYWGGTSKAPTNNATQT